MRARKPLSLPDASKDQWEEAFRRTEAAFARNKSRRWVLQILKDELALIVSELPRTP